MSGRHFNTLSAYVTRNESTAKTYRNIEMHTHTLVYRTVAHQCVDYYDHACSNFSAQSECLSSNYTMNAYTDRANI